MNISVVLNKPSFPKKFVNELNNLGLPKVINAYKITEDEAISKLKGTEILVCGMSGFEKIDQKLISGLKKLKFISVLGSGTDWINTSFAKQQGIIISTTKGSNAESVAEHIWGMILNLSKRITESDRAVRTNFQTNPLDYQGNEMFGKTIGIVGLGKIGKRVAEIATIFKMKILGINKSKNSVKGVQLVNRNTLLSQSDIICLCLPLNSQTKHYIGQKEISEMKTNSILINCAREQLVDKLCVSHGLNEGKLFGYGVELDWGATLGKTDPYLQHPRIITTPHNAGSTPEAYANEDLLTIKNIKSFVKGNPINTV